MGGVVNTTHDRLAAGHRGGAVGSRDKSAVACMSHACQSALGATEVRLTRAHSGVWPCRQACACLWVALSKSTNRSSARTDDWDPVGVLD